MDHNDLKHLCDDNLRPLQIWHLEVEDQFKISFNFKDYKNNCNVTCFTCYYLYLALKIEIKFNNEFQILNM
ncbi:hypothetical protein BpHYR1_024962 [Brachionus plicatilis]|uniref:Uncharacterized protein n=1 Tax=Brachionus plicatilis TaxID=10195 RepID=A0A3M7QFP9_BRAPC|nr:hypothetical protein BpHYR1_024962 [Brachionus plicatilis]